MEDAHCKFSPVSSSATVSSGTPRRPANSFLEKPSGCSSSNGFVKKMRRRIQRCLHMSYESISTK